MTREDKPFWFIRLLNSRYGGVGFWVFFLAFVVFLDFHKCRIAPSSNLTLGEAKACLSKWGPTN